MIGAMLAFGLLIVYCSIQTYLSHRLSFALPSPKSIVLLRVLLSFLSLIFFILSKYILIKIYQFPKSNYFINVFFSVQSYDIFICCMGQFKTRHKRFRSTQMEARRWSIYHSFLNSIQILFIFNFFSDSRVLMNILSAQFANG